MSVLKRMAIRLIILVCVLYVVSYFVPDQESYVIDPNATYTGTLNTDRGEYDINATGMPVNVVDFASGASDILLKGVDEDSWYMCDVAALREKYGIDYDGDGVLFVAKINDVDDLQQLNLFVNTPQHQYIEFDNVSIDDNKISFVAHNINSVIMTDSKLDTTSVIYTTGIFTGNTIPDYVYDGGYVIIDSSQM
jgi:hypothetical protein